MTGSSIEARLNRATRAGEALGYIRRNSIRPDRRSGAATLAEVADKLWLTYRPFEMAVAVAIADS